jgi:hypothetical protein
LNANFDVMVLWPGQGNLIGTGPLAKGVEIMDKQNGGVAMKPKLSQPILEGDTLQEFCARAGGRLRRDFGDELSPLPVGLSLLLRRLAVAEADRDAGKEMSALRIED